MAAKSIEKVDVHHHFVPDIYVKGTAPLDIKAL
jgi:hypothetical protein